jgi:hypothetical protein
MKEGATLVTGGVGRPEGQGHHRLRHALDAPAELCRSRAQTALKQALRVLSGVSDVPKVCKVILLKTKGDFLMHGVVLQNRVFRTLLPHVSRETLRKWDCGPSLRGAMFHVKPFSPAALAHPFALRCFTWNIFA